MNFVFSSGEAHASIHPEECILPIQLSQRIKELVMSDSPSKGYGEAVADGYRELKKHVDGTHPVPSEGPLQDGSVREAISEELKGLVEKHASKKSWPSGI